MFSFFRCPALKGVISTAGTFPPFHQIFHLVSLDYHQPCFANFENIPRFTQFQSTGARWAFPCRDEPDEKVSYSATLVIEDMIDRVKPVRTHYPIYSQKSTLLWIGLCFGFGRGCMVCHCCLPVLLRVVVLHFGEMMKVCYMKSTFSSIAIRLNLSWGSLGRMVGHLCPTCQFSQGTIFATTTIMNKKFSTPHPGDGLPDWASGPWTQDNFASTVLTSFFSNFSFYLKFS